MRTTIVAVGSAVLGALLSVLTVTATQADDPAAAQTHTVTELTRTLDGQYEINADYAAEIERLRSQLDQARPTFYEDGSWTSTAGYGCAPTAMCDN